MHVHIYAHAPLVPRTHTCDRVVRERDRPGHSERNASRDKSVVWGGGGNEGKTRGGGPVLTVGVEEVGHGGFPLCTSLLGGGLVLLAAHGGVGAVVEEQLHEGKMTLIGRHDQARVALPTHPRHSFTGTRTHSDTRDYYKHAPLTCTPPSINPAHVYTETHRTHVLAHKNTHTPA